jgi:hypothetical protein
MKLKSVFLLSMLSSGTFLSAQMPGMMTMQSSAPQGTTLGANTTSGAAGIALGNRVVMRGFVDFRFNHKDNIVKDTEEFTTSADVDFLFDFSPVTGEIHLNAHSEGVDLEQALGRYAINRDFNISFGRQLTALGYEPDEQPALLSVSKAYLWGLGRSYVDGVRANFNNGRFGFSIGAHDSYYKDSHDNNTVENLDNQNMAIDVAASLMIIPGLEARLGYAEQHEKDEDDLSQFNAWIAYNPGDLTLAFEYDNAEKKSVDYWSMLFLANYQFNEMFAATFKYSHEDEEVGGGDKEADRFTFALIFTITQNLFFNVEYSHSEVEAASDYDVEESYLEALLTF